MESIRQSLQRLADNGVDFVVIGRGGFACRVLGLNTLIAAKRAVGRQKDLDAATELEVIREALRRKYGF